MKDLLIQSIALQPEERMRFLNENDIYLTDLMNIIGSPDSQLRDELAFRIFVEALYADCYSNEELKQVVQALVSEEFLFLEIGAQEDPTVFTRSFSALWLSFLLKVDAQKSFLNEDEINEVFSKISSYLIKEKDCRGFMHEEGWANAVRHAGDMYIAAIIHPHFQLRYVSNFLQGISSALWRENVFIDDEEQRLAQLINSLSKVDYPEEVLVEWIEQLFDKLEYALYEQGYSRRYYQAKTNTVHLMQAIYFQCKFNKIYPKVQSVASYFIAKSM